MEGTTETRAWNDAQEHDARGVDTAPEDRPGVPMEAEPRPAEGAHWRTPERQPVSERHPHHAGIERPTPVVGTAQPLHGVSGLVRGAAYNIPEHYARHWAMLLAADRIDVLESRLGHALGGRLRDQGMERLAGRVERNPLAAIGVTLAGAWVAKKILF